MLYKIALSLYIGHLRKSPRALASVNIQGICSNVAIMVTGYRRSQDLQLNKRSMAQFEFGTRSNNLNIMCRLLYTSAPIYEHLGVDQ